MKRYELENKYVLIEKDETTGEQKIIGTGDDGDEYEKFYSLSNDENDLFTLYIPRDDGTVFVIEGVTGIDADYEDSGFILYQKKNQNGDELNFAYLFEENRILELGIEEDSGFYSNFYINEEEGKKLASYIDDNELVYFSFISFFSLDDEFFFEIEPGKFRIFGSEEIDKQPFYSVNDDENGVTIFFERDGDLYREIIRTENQIEFYNAYLKQNEISGRYELYGFKNGKPFLLGSGKIFQEINGDVRLDDLIWHISSDDDWLLEYEPEKYEEPKQELKSELESRYESRQEEQHDNSDQNEPKVTVHGLDDSRYFSAGNQSERKQKPWWKLW